MDFAKVLTHLRQELENVDTAIKCLERLNQGGLRRGLPPAWLVPAKRPGSKPNRKTRPNAKPAVPRNRIDGKAL
jgi:hypothetical protein